MQLTETFEAIIFTSTKAIIKEMWTANRSSTWVLERSFLMLRINLNANSLRAIHFLRSNLSLSRSTESMHVLEMDVFGARFHPQELPLHSRHV